MVFQIVVDAPESFVEAVGDTEVLPDFHPVAVCKAVVVAAVLVGMVPAVLLPDSLEAVHKAA